MRVALRHAALASSGFDVNRIAQYNKLGILATWILLVAGMRSGLFLDASLWVLLFLVAALGVSTLGWFDAIEFARAEVRRQLQFLEQVRLRERQAENWHLRPLFQSLVPHLGHRERQNLALTAVCGAYFVRKYMSAQQRAQLRTMHQQIAERRAGLKNLQWRLFVLFLALFLGALCICILSKPRLWWFCAVHLLTAIMLLLRRRIGVLMLFLVFAMCEAWVWNAFAYTSVQTISNWLNQLTVVDAHSFKWCTRLGLCEIRLQVAQLAQYGEISGFWTGSICAVGLCLWNWAWSSFYGWIFHNAAVVSA